MQYANFFLYQNSDDISQLLIIRSAIIFNFSLANNQEKINIDKELIKFEKKL